MVFSKHEINEYLFYEFGFDLTEDESVVSDNYPYELNHIADIKLPNKANLTVFEFYERLENEEFFVLINDNHLSIVEKNGLNVDDLVFIEVGSSWIGENEPIDLSTTRIGDDKIPPLNERKTSIEKMIANFGIKNFQVLEGLYLTRLEKYITLLKNNDTEEILIIRNDFSPFKVELPNVNSKSRLLSWGIGKMLTDSFKNES